MDTALRIGKNATFLAAAKFGGYGLSLALTVFATHILGPGGYGHFAFALSFASMFAVLLDCGLSPLTVREVARQPLLTGLYFGNGMALKSGLSLIALAVVSALVKALGYPPSTVRVVQIAFASVALLSFTDFIASIFRAYQRMEYEAAENFLNQIVKLAAGVLALRFGLGVFGLAGAHVLAGGVGLAFALLILRRFPFQLEVNFRTWPAFIWEALPFGLAGVFIFFLHKVDHTILSLLRGDEAVGWYAAAYNLIFLISFLSKSFAQSVFPVMSASEAVRLRELYSRSMRCVLLIALPILVGGLILAEPLIFSLYPPDFSESVGVLRLLLPSVLLLFLAHLDGNVLAALNRQSVNIYISGLAVAFNVGMNFLVIPLWGHQGAAVVATLSYLLNAALQHFLVRKYLPGLPYSLGLSKLFLAVAVMALACFWMKEIPIFFSLPLGAAVYFGVLYLSRAFSMEELALVKGLLRVP